MSTTASYRLYLQLYLNAVVKKFGKVVLNTSILENTNQCIKIITKRNSVEKSIYQNSITVKLRCEIQRKFSAIVII